MKKITLLFTLGLAVALLYAYEPFNGEHGFEDAEAFSNTPPPILTNVKLKKIVPDAQGNNLIMKVKYIEDDTRLQNTLDLNLGNNNRITLKDNGLYPDEVLGDKEYSIAIIENIASFKTQIQNNLAKIKSKATLDYYVGYSSINANTEAINFDMDGFDAGQEVDLDFKLIVAADCGSALLKEKSLFITDLSVVEDLARTYNTKYDLGNPKGCWTFGQMIKNIANEPVTGVSAKKMLKDWLKSYMYDEYILDPNNTSASVDKLEKRDKILNQLILPWLGKCIYKEHYNIVAGAPSLTGLVNVANGANASLTFVDFTLDANNNEISNTTTALDFNINANNWETIWDDVNLTEDQILKYAPFKLMAISNRIDMRSNNAYNTVLNGYRGGETRFIFTLVNLIGVPSGDHGVGMPPKHDNMDFLGGIDFFDWEGMNVILEYGNSSTDVCKEKGLGQEWLNLSDAYLYPAFPLPPYTASNYIIEKTKSEDYNAALQLITDKVTKANADTRRAGNNYSAINQIRTNEKLFHNIFKNQSLAAWDEANWELRQFEINSTTHNIQRVNVTNVPNKCISTNSCNYSNNAKPTNNAFNINNSGTNEYNTFNYSTHNTDLLDWIKSKPGKAYQIIFHNFNLPKAYQNIPSTTTPNVYNAPSALMHDERHTYQEIWTKENNTVVNAQWVLGFNNKLKVQLPNDNVEQTARRLRHGVSISTCQGCHGGDTKTAFTMVHPRGYGQSAIYWGTNPDVITATSTRVMDDRFEKNTKQAPVENNYHPVVSSFITGTAVNGGDDFSDMNTLNIDDDKDANPNVNDYAPATMYGSNLFYVDDPSDYVDAKNSAGNVIVKGYPQFADVNGTHSFLNTKLVVGYNELDRRRQDMCAFLGNTCLGLQTMQGSTSNSGSKTIAIISAIKYYPSKM